MDGAPFFGWDEDTIKAYIVNRPLEAGDSMLIYNGQWNMHNYVLATVINPALGRQKRVVLSAASATGEPTFLQKRQELLFTDRPVVHVAAD